MDLDPVQLSAYYGIRTHTSGSYRTEKLNGQDYIVVPVIALVEGVIQGAMAEQPELALASEFGRFCTAWNGHPVTLDHPYVTDDETGEIIRVSASATPEVREEFQVGFIFSTQIKDSTKLSMEVWLDPIRMQTHSDESREMMRKIRAGEQIEVSTGLFANTEQSHGKYDDGREYFNIWRGIIPDHLALLPGDTIGACSIADGCGVYANSTRASSQSAHKLNPKLPSLDRLNSFHVSCGCGGTCGKPTCTGGTQDQHDSDASTYTGTNSLVSHLGTLGTHPPAKLNLTPSESHPPQSGATLLSSARSVPKGKSMPQKPTTLNVNVNAPAITSETSHVPETVKFNAEVFLAQSLPDGMLDSDVRTILQNAVDDKWPNAYAYIVGFTQEVVVLSMYDSMYSSRGTYQISYSIDNAAKTATLDEDAVAVILTTQITELPDDGDADDAYDSSTRSPFGNSARQQTAENNMPTSTNTPTPRTPIRSNARPAPIPKEQLTAMATILSNAAKGGGKAGSEDSETDDDDAGDDDDGKTNAKDGKTKGNPTTMSTNAATTTNAAPAPAVAEPPKVMTAAEYLEKAPLEIRESLAAGMKMHAERKAALVAALKANSRNKFTEDQLKSFDIGMLENLAELGKVPDYSGQAPGGSGLHAQTQQEMKINEADMPYAAAPPRLVVNNAGAGAGTGDAPLRSATK